MKNKNIIIINRWSDDYADYVKLINHFDNRIFYITNVNGGKYLIDKDNYPHKLVIVDDLKNFSLVKEEIVKIKKEVGEIDIVVAMSEFDLLVAAQIREYFSVDGMDIETTLNFIDKTVMKRKLRNSSVSCPAYIRDMSQVNSFVKKIGFPIVFKPRQGAASEGVFIVKDEQELESIKETVINDSYECEQYIDSPIIHIDGIVQNEKILFVKASRYINTCYDYANGIPLGSIIITDKRSTKKIFSFTEQVIKTLKLKDGVFHLEAFYAEDEIIFLEIGARQGGGEIVPLMKLLYGVDLVKALFFTQIGSPIYLEEQLTTETGGFLLIPEPQNTPCVVKNITDVSEIVRTLQKKVVPVIGSVLDGHGGYYFNSGRFIFIGEEKQIENDIFMIINSFQINTEAVLI